VFHVRHSPCVLLNLVMTNEQRISRRTVLFAYCDCHFIFESTQIREDDEYSSGPVSSNDNFANNLEFLQLYTVCSRCVNGVFPKVYVSHERRVRTLGLRNQCSLYSWTRVPLLRLVDPYTYDRSPDGVLTTRTLYNVSFRLRHQSFG